MCTLFPTHVHTCLRYIQRATSVQQYPALDLADENKAFLKGHSFDGHKKDAILISRVCALPVSLQKEKQPSSHPAKSCTEFTHTPVLFIPRDITRTLVTNMLGGKYTCECAL